MKIGQEVQAIHEILIKYLTVFQRLKEDLGLDINKLSHASQ
jgi:hypothetical protein